MNSSKGMSLFSDFVQIIGIRCFISNDVSSFYACLFHWSGLFLLYMLTEGLVT